jgi:hypothetical protein
MKYATVQDVIDILTKLKNDGFGDYEVVCNEEYALAKKGEVPEINERRKHISLGGYN